MPIIIQSFNTKKSIDLEEYIEILDSKKIDFNDQNQIIDSAIYFEQLNNNKNFLVNKICKMLENDSSLSLNNFYGPQVFMLHSNDQYFVRAVVWNPITKIEKSIENFSYDVCHDHNFDILTAGYLGGGYKSRCYTYDYSKTTGGLGEKVNLENKEIYNLGEGDIFLYRAKKDVHMQLPPDEISVSLNLIPRTDKIYSPQFQFDEEKHEICRYLHSSGSELIIRLAGIVGNDNFIEPLKKILLNNPSSHVRALAASSVTSIAPQLSNEIYESVLSDKSEMMKEIFKMESKRSGTCLELHN
jgi:hypothetical protein